LQLVKRVKQHSPLKVSPSAKKLRNCFEKTLHGGGLQHLSPKKSGQTKRLLFGKSILKLKATDVDNLAKVSK